MALSWEDAHLQVPVLDKTFVPKLRKLLLKGFSVSNRGPAFVIHDEAVGTNFTDEEVFATVEQVAFHHLPYESINIACRKFYVTTIRQRYFHGRDGYGSGVAVFVLPGLYIIGLYGRPNVDAVVLPHLQSVVQRICDHLGVSAPRASE
eukprot:GILJ01002355.1.p1 GENE.GILJ01002355.1~~GILJ01002355.1.p1  ORF type:complete len:148 (+),score=15.90 GILJ01002355.1:44-487(+)